MGPKYVAHISIHFCDNFYWYLSYAFLGGLHEQVQISHGSPYTTHTGLGQPQGAAAVVAGTARPRVRARRGQATDPHSIAERVSVFCL